MRGTLHLLRADELALYTGALARLRPRYEVPAWQRNFGVTHAQAEAMLAAVAEELAGPPRTRAELAAGAAARAGNPALEAKLARGFGELLKPAAFTGDLCFAPPDGQRVRFTRPAVWLDGFAHPGPDEASRPRGRPALPARVRPGAARAVPALVRHDVARRGGALAAGARRRGRGGRRRGVARLDARRRRRARRPRRSLPASCGCCPRSTTTSSRRRAAPRPCCPPAAARSVYRPQGWLSPGDPGRRPHGRRPGSTRSSGARRA